MLKKGEILTGQYNAAICHNMVPCKIGQVTDSKPQLDMCSPDIGRIMEYDTMKHKGSQFYHDMQISWPDSDSPPIRLSDS